MSRVRWLSFLWSPDRQEIACDGERFAHPVATGTAPSHDVAHLLAAASGLPWKPRGTRAEISFAELNAVLLEHLAVNVLDAFVLGRDGEASALARTVEHARWFVEVDQPRCTSCHTFHELKIPRTASSRSQDERGRGHLAVRSEDRPRRSFSLRPIRLAARACFHGGVSHEE